LKTIEVLYGKGTMKAQIEDKNLQQVIELDFPESTKTQEEIVREALDNPIGSPTLAELTKNVKKILIISNDITRPTPSKLLVSEMIKKFAKPAEEYEITILIATGLHRKMTDAEILERFGEELVSKYKIINHVATDEENLVKICEMSGGYDLWVNKLLKENDLVISDGFIEPHLFAGFSGGRKSILPGVSGYKTILGNHCPGNIDHPKARTSIIDGNKFHNECLEGAKKAGLKFILNVALNKEKKVIAAFAGDVEKAHAKGCEFVKNLVSVPSEMADIVVTSNNGYPLDRNVYQTAKGMDAASGICREGGVIIVVAQCLDGVGHKAFGDLMASCATAEELYQKFSKGETIIDQWQVQVFSRMMRRFNVILVTDEMETKDVERLHYTHAKSLQEALSMAFEIAGKDAKVSVIPEGPVVIPVPKK